MQDWLGYHPYDNSTAYDSYYWTLCNKVLKIILNTDIRKRFDTDEAPILLACLLVAYFEDVISETKQFSSFTEQHKKMYGTYLPFYNTDNEYYTDEVNLYDIYFLFWYYSSVLDESKLHDPFFGDNPGFVVACEKICDLFDEEFEKAPQNEVMQAFFQLDASAGVTQIRAVLEFLLNGSFWNKTSFAIRMADEVNELLEEEKKEEKEYSMDRIEAYLYDISVEEIFNFHSPVLALRTNEMLANMIGVEHPLYDTIRNISERKTGLFLFREEQPGVDIFEHIPSGTRIRLSQEYSMFEREQLVAGKSCCLMGIVEWGDVWQQMGMASLFVYDEEKFKEQIPGASIFDSLEKKMAIVKNMETAFREVNQDKLLVSLKGQRAFNDFYRLWMGAQTKMVHPDMTDEEIREHLDNILDKSNLMIEEDQETILYLNPEGGVEEYYGLEGLKDADTGSASGKCNFETLILDDCYSKNFINYLIGNDLIEFSTDQSGMDNSLVSDNLDFLLRYFRRSGYQAEPEVTLVSESAM
jgi:hypothetical protein